MSQEKEKEPQHPQEIKEDKKLNEELPEKEKPKEKEKEIDQDNSDNFSNEVRVNLRSQISSLLDMCEKILVSQKTKELQLSASGQSISKLIALVEIVKSLHPSLIQETVLTTFPSQNDEGKNLTMNERNKLVPKIDIILSEERPQGKISEKMTEEKKEKLIEIWERQKGLNNRRQMNNRRWGLNRGRNFSPNNRRNGFVKNWGFRYGNMRNRWQMNNFGNMGNWNRRNFNGNWNYMNNWRS